MKRLTAPWVHKAEEDWAAANALAHQRPPLRDTACFHCQEAAEKYLKALLKESGAAVPRTHELKDVLDLLLPHDPTLAPLRRGLVSLSRYAVDYRYPDQRATQRQMGSALRNAGRVRRELRTRLGLPP
jgi:HEPN domain-containing protein